MTAAGFAIPGPHRYPPEKRGDRQRARRAAGLGLCGPVSVGRLKNLFREANAIARQFTWPVVISTKAVSGVCSAGIGTCVVINEEGWIVTAHHIVDQWEKLAATHEQVKELKAKRSAIENDASMSGTQRHKALNKIGMLNKDAPEQVSIWFGGGDLVHPLVVANGQFLSLPAVDLAVAKLEPFDPKWVTTYPTFKDPDKDYEPGQSLCKLGFPLHQITPIWNAGNARFEIPPEALPLPIFPIEGILTRFAKVVIEGQPDPPFPMNWIETSSPGLRGQSGGPMFDQRGTVWGIQVQTHSYDLGFNTGTRTQFLNVGLGVHAATLINFFKEVGIKFQLSPY